MAVLNNRPSRVRGRRFMRVFLQIVPQRFLVIVMSWIKEKQADFEVNSQANRQEVRFIFHTQCSPSIFLYMPAATYPATPESINIIKQNTNKCGWQETPIAQASKMFWVRKRALNMVVSPDLLSVKRPSRNGYSPGRPLFENLNICCWTMIKPMLLIRL